MPARLSTGLVNKLMTQKCFRDIFSLGFIDIYTGSQPLKADDPSTGTKLLTLYSDGNAIGLNWEPTASSGTITKRASESWTGTVLADGQAGWFRLREPSDTGSNASTTAARYDGSIANVGGQMTLGVTTLTAGAPFLVMAASFSLPQN